MSEFMDAYCDLGNMFPPSVEFDTLPPYPSDAMSACGRFSVLKRPGRNPLRSPTLDVLRLPPLAAAPSMLMSLIPLLLILLLLLRRTYTRMEIPITANRTKKPTKLPTMIVVSCPGDR